MSLVFCARRCHELVGQIIEVADHDFWMARVPSDNSTPLHPVEGIALLFGFFRDPKNGNCIINHGAEMGLSLCIVVEMLIICTEFRIRDRTGWVYDEVVNQFSD